MSSDSLPYCRVLVAWLLLQSMQFLSRRVAEECRGRVQEVATAEAKQEVTPAAEEAKHQEAIIAIIRKHQEAAAAAKQKAAEKAK
jgi:hypothetical protein